MVKGLCDRGAFGGGANQFFRIFVIKERKVEGKIEKVILTIIGACLIISLIGIYIGWLIPIEGPFDYLYDNYASQPAHKHPASYAPPQPKQFIIDINDLSEEDFEALQEIFTNR